VRRRVLELEKLFATLSMVLIILISAASITVSNNVFTAFEMIPSEGAESPTYLQTFTEYSDGANWPMFHHDLRHTGFSESLAPTTNHTLWKYNATERVTSSPSVVDGKVYFGSEIYENGWSSGYIYALDEEIGALIWLYEANQWITSSPAVLNGKVFVAGFNGDIFCLNATTGKKIWSYNVGAIRMRGSPAVAYGKVFVTIGTGTTFALDEETGSRIWSIYTGADTSSPAVVNGKVFIGGGYSNMVLCLNETTGTTIWNNTAGHVDSSPTVVNGKVYAGSLNHNIYCFSELDGEKIWNYTVDGEMYSSPAVAYGRVYIGSMEGYNSSTIRGKVYCVDADTGSEIWNYSVNNWIVFSSPAVADGKVYIGCIDGCLYCLDALSGELRWKYKTGGLVNSSPAIANGKVFVGSYDGYLYCFGPEPPVDLPVPYEAQGDTSWCWAASTAMVLRYYGKPVHVWDLGKTFEFSLGLRQIESYIHETYAGEFETIIGSYSSISEQTRKHIEGNLSSGYPVLLNVNSSGTTQLHNVVLTGFNSSGFFVNDPSVGALFTISESSATYPYIHEFVLWEELQRLICKDIGCDDVFLVVKGTSSPLDATLFFHNGEKHIRTIHASDSEKGVCIDYGSEYSYLGVYWRSLDWHPIAWDLKDTFKYSYEIFNHKNKEALFDFRLQIKGEDEIVYYEENISNILVLAFDNKTISVWEISLKDYLMEGQKYVVTAEISFCGSQEIIDSIDLPPIYYGVKSILFTTECPVRMLVTDPDGLRVGFDYVSNQTVSEILEALYYYGNRSEPEVISIPKQKIGNYTVAVFGIESGIYNLTCARLDETGFMSIDRLIDVSIKKGESQTYVIPEFPSLLIMSLFMIGTLLVIAAYRRKRSMQLHRI